MANALFAGTSDISQHSTRIIPKRRYCALNSSRENLRITNTEKIMQACKLTGGHPECRWEDCWRRLTNHWKLWADLFYSVQNLICQSCVYESNYWIVHNYNFTGCFLLVKNLVPNPKEGTRCCVIQNTVVTKMFGPKGKNNRRIKRNEEFHHLYQIVLVRSYQVGWNGRAVIPI